MSTIPLNMISFVQEHHVLSLATVENNIPVSCSVFYLFIPEEGSFIFASDEGTEHMKNILENSNVSAGIHDETKELQYIRGIQIKGQVSTADKSHIQSYLQEYPYAAKIEKKRIWKLKITGLKYTDNKDIGLGKKEVWKY